MQYNILKRDAEANKALYDGLLTKLKEAGISAGLQSSNIRVVDPAMIPSYPCAARENPQRRSRFHRGSGRRHRLGASARVSG